MKGVKAGTGPLRDYRAKRDFKVTSEPSGAGRARKRTDGGKFVIHKHDATRLHYDLRLEHDGVLWSWAVTRGPSLDPSDKRLAVHVEDHPLDYATFEGIIPKGQYGAGAVILWDEGEWIPAFDAAWGLEKGHLRFELKGAKLNGEWHLVRLKPRRGEKTDNWLFFKSDDPYASSEVDILEDAPQSVKSGLTLEELRDGRTKARAKPAATPQASTAKRKAPPSARTAAPAKAAKGKAAAAKTARLAFVEPCLAKLAAVPPSGDNWVHEIKFDGYRMQAHVAGGKVKLLTRTGLDWTSKFGTAIPAALLDLDLDSAILDGEVVVTGENGASSFSDLQVDLSEGRSDRFIYYAFDLLHLDGAELTDETLAARVERLQGFVDADADGALRLSQQFHESGRRMLQHVCRIGLEGIVSKRLDAPYASGRNGDWVKAKCTLRQEFVIAGYLPSQKSGRGLRSLVVGYVKDGTLRTAGHVGTGFSSRAADDLLKRMKARVATSSPFTGPAAKEKGVVWLEPELVAEVEFRSWTHDGIIRHASYQGLRDDKPAREVVMEKPVEDPVPQTKKAKAAAGKTEAPKAGGKTTAKKKAAGGDAVTLSSPDKKLWPDEGVTKKDLLDYYEQVWPRMEPFVVNRPLALVRAPDGIHGQRFFQKHALPGTPASVLRMRDPEDNEELLSVESFDGIAALVQLGVVEIHIWGSKTDDIEKPDQIVLDLDPDEGLDFDDVRAAALDVRGRLDELGLPSFVKTTGGKGLHVVIPLKPKADWKVVKTFAHDFAQAMAQTAPDRYTAVLSKKARTGRIFVDYLRNGKGATAVAPYSSRARKGATMAMPITWEMVEAGVDPADYAIGSKGLAARLKASDPWADFRARAKALAVK
ncbi:MAG: DNA ligase D [Rhizobiaceae bacterium]|nr:DNA ligase D [Rhizobiaceae bacterium]